MTANGSEYINSTSGRKSDTGSGFSDIYFLYDVESFAVYVGDFSLRMRSFDHITTSGLKSDVIIEFSASVFLERCCHLGRTTPFLATFVTIVSAHAQQVN